MRKPPVSAAAQSRAKAALILWRDRQLAPVLRELVPMLARPAPAGAYDDPDAEEAHKHYELLQDLLNRLDDINWEYRVRLSTIERAGD